MSKLDNLKFLAFVGVDGYPVLIPTIQAQVADAEQSVFSTAAYRDDLTSIPEGATVAMLGISLDMEDVLMRGEFQRLRRIVGIRCGCIRVNWVHSPLPPKPQQIYPPLPLETVASF